jgi:hypothetical protein
VAVLYVHALNPYGFSWWRRTTHENVDLNRNFQDFSQPLPANAGYDELPTCCCRRTGRPPPRQRGRPGRLRPPWATCAADGDQPAASTTHPEGLFYGGRNPTWSQQTLRHVLQEHGTRCRRLAWIDLHTGLGPSGHGERIFAGRDDAATLANAPAPGGGRS